MAIDHIMLKVSDWKRAKEYYVAAFAPLGYEMILDNPKIGGFAVQGSYNGRIYVAEVDNPGRCHIALTAPSADAVKEYYETAIAKGGTDNGAPGYRAHFKPGGVGCFVIDLDDNNIEVVHHGGQ